MPRLVSNLRPGHLSDPGDGLRPVAVVKEIPEADNSRPAQRDSGERLKLEAEKKLQNLILTLKEKDTDELNDMKRNPRLASNIRIAVIQELVRREAMLRSYSLEPLDIDK